MAKKKTGFITRKEQEEIRERYGDWVADSIAFGGDGRDIDYGDDKEDEE